MNTKRAELLARLGQLAEDAASGVHLSVLLLLVSTAAAADTPWLTASQGLQDLHVLAAGVLLVRLWHSFRRHRASRAVAAPDAVKAARRAGRRVRRKKVRRAKR